MTLALTYGCSVSELRHQAGDCISLDCFSFIKKLGSGGKCCEVSRRVPGSSVGPAGVWRAAVVVLRCRDVSQQLVTGPDRPLPPGQRSERRRVDGRSRSAAGRRSPWTPPAPGCGLS